MIGTRIGPYEVAGELGAGGMGVVYEARDTTLDRQVAIKVLPPELARDGERLERFRREAKAIAALNHPGIVTVHGLVEEGGSCFLIMERIEGRRLDELIPEGGLSFDRFMALVVPIADALAAAHDKGIVHRDVKPANVMVTGDGRVKLLDFGLAKLAEQRPALGTEDPTRTAGLTRFGALMGTVPYMSPEQLQGREIDARSDVFSLGVLLYELAAGRRPFDASSNAALASSILRDAPPPLSEQRPDLPRALERIVVACLEKEPAQRPRSAREVRDRLDALREAGVEPADGEAAAPERAGGRPGRARRWVWAAAVVAAVAAGLAGIVASRRLEDPSRAPDAAAGSASARADGARDRSAAQRVMLVVLPFEHLGAPGDEYLTDGISEEIRGRLATVEGLGVISRTTSRRFRGEQPTLAQLATELHVDYVVEGAVQWQPEADGTRRVRVTPQLVSVSDDVQVWTRTYDAVPADFFELQSDIARQVAERLDIELAEPRRAALERAPTTSMEAYDAYLRAQDAFERGKELESRDTVLGAIAEYERAVALDPAFTLAQARLGEAHGYTYFYLGDRREERLQAARDATTRALELDPELPEAHYALGLIRVNERDTAAALAEYDLVTRTRPNYAEAYWASSLIHTVAGEWDEAYEAARKATELNPRAARHFCQMGGTSQAAGRYADALTYHDRAILVEGERACPYYCVIEVLLSMGDVPRARSYLDGLPQHVDRVESPSIDYIGVQLDLIEGRHQEALARLAANEAEAYEAAWVYRPKRLFAAQIHELMRSPDLARADYDAARAHLEPLTQSRPYDVRVHSALSIAYAGLERRDDTLRTIDTTLQLLRGREGLYAPYALRELAHARLLLGDRSAALDLLERHLSFSGYLPAAFLKIDPTWAAMRAEPRFQSLLETYADGYRALSAG